MAVHLKKEERGKRGKGKGNIEIIENTAIFFIIFIWKKKRKALFCSKLKLFVWPQTEEFLVVPLCCEDG